MKTKAKTVKAWGFADDKSNIFIEELYYYKKSLAHVLKLRGFKSKIIRVEIKEVTK